MRCTGIGLKAQRKEEAMRKSLAVAISCIVLLVWWFCQNLHVKAQGGAGADCELVRYAADANGDGKVDISDPVYILRWLFQGGPPPCAHAQSCDFCLTQEQSQMLEEIAFGRNIAGTYQMHSTSTNTFSLLTLSADGTAQYDAEEQFGHWPTGPETPDHFASTFRCTWKRIGERQIQFRNTRINFLEDGTPLCVPEIFPIGTFAEGGFDVISGTWSFKVCSWDSWCAGGCDVVNEGTGGTWRATRIPIEDKQP
jgi:hypothetical protein